MSYGLLADVVMVVHFAFVVFVVVGGAIAWWWPRVLWLHAPAVIWGAAIVVIGFTCPLTPLERELRFRAGQGRFEESFIERYIEGVLYPGPLTQQMQAAAAAVVVASWAALLFRRRRERVAANPLPGSRRLDCSSARSGDGTV